MSLMSARLQVLRAIKFEGMTVALMLTTHMSATSDGILTNLV